MPLHVLLRYCLPCLLLPVLFWAPALLAQGAWTYRVQEPRLPQPYQMKWSQDPERGDVIWIDQLLASELNTEPVRTTLWMYWPAGSASIYLHTLRPRPFRLKLALEAQPGAAEAQALDYRPGDTLRTATDEMACWAVIEPDVRQDYTLFRNLQRMGQTNPAYVELLNRLPAVQLVHAACTHTATGELVFEIELVEATPQPDTELLNRARQDLAQQDYLTPEEYERQLRRQLEQRQPGSTSPQSPQPASPQPKR